MPGEEDHRQLDSPLAQGGLQVETGRSRACERRAARSPGGPAAGSSGSRRPSRSPGLVAGGGEQAQQRGAQRFVVVDDMDQRWSVHRFSGVCHAAAMAGSWTWKVAPCRAGSRPGFCRRAPRRASARSTGRAPCPGAWWCRTSRRDAAGSRPRFQGRDRRTERSISVPRVRMEMTIVRRSSGWSVTASMALSTRFISTCCSWIRSPRTLPIERRRTDLERHPPPARLRAEQGLDLAHRLVDLEGDALDLVPRQQRPELADHLAGPQIVTADVAENRARAPRRRSAPVASISSAASALARIAPSGWLISWAIEPRELAGDGEARSVRELEPECPARRARRRGGDGARSRAGRSAPPGAGDRDRGDRDVAIGRPERRLPEVDDGVGGDAPLVDPPAADLPPVDAEGRRRGLGEAQRRGRCAGEDRVDRFAASSPISSKLGMRPPTTPVPRTWRKARRPAPTMPRPSSRCVPRREDLPRAVLKVAGSEDDRVAPQRAETVPQARGGERREKLDVGAPGERRPRGAAGPRTAVPHRLRSRSPGGGHRDASAAPARWCRRSRIRSARR